MKQFQVKGGPDVQKLNKLSKYDAGNDSEENYIGDEEKKHKFCIYPGQDI